MSRKPWLYITLDATISRALLRGEGALEACDVLGIPNMWSRSGRGWVIDAAKVPDVTAFAQSRHELVVVHDRKDGVT